MYIYSSRSIASLIQLYHTIQKGLDDACVDSYSVALFPEMSPETDSTLCPALIRVILSRRKTNIIQEIKGLMNKLCFVLLSRRKTRLLFPCLLVFTWLGLHYIVLSGLSVKQEVKGLTTNYINVHYPG